MEDPMSVSVQDRSPPLLHTLVKFHTRFCSSSSSTVLPHLPPLDYPQPMDLDNNDPHPPITIIQTLVSNPHEDEHHETLAIRNAFLRCQIRTPDVENSSDSLEAADVAVDMASIFRVWDLNTESPQLEDRTLTEVLTALATKPEKFWFDEGQRILRAADAMDLREMRLALDDVNGVDISVSALLRLLRSIL